jgi:hypothetical protein
MTNALIWAAALFIPLMTLVLGLLGPARRALALWGDSYGKSAAEREAKAALDLAEAAESRHKLAVRREHLADEVRFERARLAEETAQAEVDTEAARQCLPDAVEARRRVLAARAEAEAALAPEAAREAATSSDTEVMAALGEAYAVFCQEYGFADVPTFGRWVQGFNGVPRG